MMHKVKYILIIFIMLILVMFAVFCIKNNKPAAIIKRKINLQLPSDSNIIHFSSAKFGKYLDAKIQINEMDIESVKKDLLGFFEEEYQLADNHYILKSYMLPWWNINKEDIQMSCFVLVDGPRFLFSSIKTQIICAIITKENNEYFLYLTW